MNNLCQFLYISTNLITLIGVQNALTGVGCLKMGLRGHLLITLSHFIDGHILFQGLAKY